MTSVIAAGIPSPQVNSFQLGPLTVHFYALCILTGIVIASVVAGRRLRTRGVEAGKIVDIAIWAVPIALVGGRLYHVVTHPGDYFAPGDNFWTIFALWDGGLAIYGSILVGSFGAWIGCRRAKVRFSDFADAVAPGMLFAQAFGRLGNYFNQELFGPPTTLLWGLQISSTSPHFPPGTPAGTLFQPLFLYELIWDSLGGLLIVLLGRRLRLPRTVPVGMYFLWYGAGRAYLEWIRLDPTEFTVDDVKANTIAAILGAILGLLIIIRGIRNTSTGLSHSTAALQLPDTRHSPHTPHERPSADSMQGLPTPNQQTSTDQRPQNR